MVKINTTTVSNPSIIITVIDIPASAASLATGCCDEPAIISLSVCIGMKANSALG